MCNYTCPDGYRANGACNGCVTDDVCIAKTPCQHGGTCTVATPDEYFCTCAGPFTGTDCEGN